MVSISINIILMSLVVLYYYANNIIIDMQLHTNFVVYSAKVSISVLMGLV